MMNIFFLVRTGVLSRIATLWGGVLGTQASLHTAIVAIIIGDTILFVVGGLMTYIGATSHQSVYETMRYIL